MTGQQFLGANGEQFDRELKSFIAEKANYTVFNSFVAKAVAKTAGEFAGEVKKEVPRFFKTFSTKKLASITGHRGKEKNRITYHVGAGEGIPGHLNFLSGLYEGQATSRSGKVFRFKQPRDIITAASRKFGAQDKCAMYFDQYIKEFEKQ